MDTFMENRTNVLLIGIVAIGMIFILVGIFGLINDRKIHQQTFQSSVPKKVLTATQPILDPAKIVEELPTDKPLTGEQIPLSLRDPDKLIELYTRRLEKSPPPEEVPALLTALGNLYKDRKQDCTSAVQYYERVVIEYPDWEGTKSVYPLLGMCYEELNDSRGKIWLYQEMMRRFPPDSQEYIYAKTELGLGSVEDELQQQIDKQTEEQTETPAEVETTIQ